jgi:SET domain-containing protein
MKIECRKSDLHGYGVFAKEFIASGELIERCPIIRIEVDDTPHIRDTVLRNYLFDWSSKESSACALVMGYGMVYNHSYSPNSKNGKNFKESSMDHYAIRDIHAGEEITINYGGEPESKKQVWFNMKETNAPVQKDTMEELS